MMNITTLESSTSLVAKLRDITVDSASSTLKDVSYRDLGTGVTLTPINTELRKVTFGSVANDARYKGERKVA